MSIERELLKSVCDVLASARLGNIEDIEVLNSIYIELAKPEPEPVAWLWQSDNYATTFSQRIFQYKLEADQMIIRHSGKLYPLYTSPPARKSLSDDEIDSIKFYQISSDFDAALRRFARAIEKAHGIGEQ
jgi:hypothetical protein